MECSHYTDNSGIYELKFPKEVPVVGWGKWAPFLPQFFTSSSFAAGMHFF